MTREEAIRVLEDNRPSVIFEDKDAQKRMEELCQALDIAIEVLSVKDCHGCTHYDLLQTPVICHDCSRAYKDRYKDEKRTLDDMFTESEEAYKAWTGEEMGGTSERKNVAYICDKRRCDKEGCSNCGRTTDIEHAKNFELINNTYYERW